MRARRDASVQIPRAGQLSRARHGGTYTKIGSIQRRLAWPLRKDDTQIREALHLFGRDVRAPLLYLPLSRECTAGFSVGALGSKISPIPFA